MNWIIPLQTVGIIYTMDIFIAENYTKKFANTENKLNSNTIYYEYFYC